MPPVNLVNQRISAFGGGKSPGHQQQNNFIDSGTQKSYNAQRNTYTTVNNGNTVTTTMSSSTTKTMWQYSSETSSTGPAAVTNPAYMGMGFTQTQNSENPAG